MDFGILQLTKLAIRITYRIN